MTVGEFRGWLRVMEKEPTAAERLEFWLIQLFTLLANVNRKAKALPLTAADAAAAGLGEAFRAGLPDRWGDRKGRTAAGWLRGKALGEAFKAGMQARAGKPPRPKPKGKPRGP